MAFIGKDLVGILSPNKIVDVMSSPNGSTTTMSLSRTPGSVNNVEIYIDGVFQTPGVEYTLASDVVTFTTAPVSGTSVVAISGDDTAIVTPEENTITSVKIADGTVTNSKLATGITSDKLLVGSIIPVGLNTDNVTGIPSGTEYTKSASDPAIDTNSGSLGKMWFNTTSGEMFVLIDATTDNNVWINVGGGTEHVLDKPFGGRGGGTVAAFTAGGYTPGGTQFHINTVDKFSIPNPSGTATDHADLTNGQTAGCSSCSATDGYSVAGQVKGYGSNPPDNPFWTKIQKYNFSSANTVSQPGDISSGGYGPGGHSSYKEGYASGGVSGSGNLARIEKFLFSNESTVSNVGNLTIARRLSNCGHSSNQRGYTATGESPTADHIERFSFVNDAETTDWGDLTQARYSSVSISSETHGYVAGGNGSQLFDIIDRFSFSSGAGASDVGNLTEQKASGAGQSGETQGYISGAFQNSGAGQALIESFTYSSSTNSSNVASLIEGRGYCTGTQY